MGGKKGDENEEKEEAVRVTRKERKGRNGLVLLYCNRTRLPRIGTSTVFFTSLLLRVEEARSIGLNSQTILWFNFKLLFSLYGDPSYITAQAV